MKLYEICAAQKLNRPRFECEAKVMSAANSTVHSFAVKCLFVGADGRVISSRGKIIAHDGRRRVGTTMCGVKFRLSGVAGKKIAAKRIAAMDVLEQIVRRQNTEDVVVRAAATGRPTSSQYVVTRRRGISLSRFRTNPRQLISNATYSTRTTMLIVFNFFFQRRRTRRMRLDNRSCRRRIHRLRPDGIRRSMRNYKLYYYAAPDAVDDRARTVRTPVSCTRESILGFCRVEIYTTEVSNTTVLQ